MPEGSAGLGEAVIINTPKQAPREINFPVSTSPEDRTRRLMFKTDVLVKYRDVPGRVVDPFLQANDVTAWWAVPVVLDGDKGYIHYLNYKTLEITSPVESVIEAKETFVQSKVFLDKRTGKIWACTNADPERFYCMNDSFTWPLFGPMDHWTPLYEKIWETA